MFDTSIAFILKSKTFFNLINYFDFHKSNEATVKKNYGHKLSILIQNLFKFNLKIYVDIA